MKAPRIPLSTYRLQFNRDFTFSQAADLVPYLASLGISHVYASPYLRARPGSMHGYDIIDHRHLNPEIGSPEDYERFVAALHEHGMGQILDIVPNHMGVMGSDNAWWLDVLENGEASLYAEYFDIDWEPLKEELRGKVLVPVLGDQYGTVLERGELKLTFEKEKGEFSIFYFQHRFPVNPREYPQILRHGLESLKEQQGAENPDILELQSLMTEFRRLPSRTRTTQERRAERARDKEIRKQRLAQLCQRSPLITNFLERSVAEVNGTSGDPASFEELHELIKAQAYRLAYWRVAADDINYRRFFDVDDLAALRQESELVFQQTHEFVLQLLREGKINGLRIDHPDGLFNPLQYFERLQRESKPSRRRSKPYYIVAEKILSGDEKLSSDWPIHGTTGYAFSNLVNGLFVDSTAEAQMDEAYASFVGKQPDFHQLLYECKKLVMDRLLNSELNVLANHLSRIALADRHTCDFTLKSLRDALAEIVACFPVYRTYIAGEAVSECDCKYIDEAVDCAKARNTASDLSVYDFIRDVLTLQRMQGHRAAYQKSVIQFAMKFQQYTSALMAKGFEDTSLYRYNRLVSLNDVGGNPLRFGVSPQEFHCTIEQRASTWPHEMLATSTHDSKRSEDVRARINVLSELAAEWNAQVSKWRELNRKFKEVCCGGEAPTANDEYLLYQTLVGAWPLNTAADWPEKSFADRICEYMLKAAREAKEITSWRYQNSEYESALAMFVQKVLGSSEFFPQFVPFARKIAFFGMINSLSQTLIKVTAPGVPDTYQGSELWEFNLVDPDNRRPVDYGVRRRALSEIQCLGAKCCEALRSGVRELAANMEDGRIKMYVMWRALGLGKQCASLFQNGEYIPLQTTGERAEHVIAFARRQGNETILTAVPRLCAQLLRGETQLPRGEEVWKNTSVVVPKALATKFTNLFTGEQVIAGERGIPAAQLFGDFPVALLRSSAE